jgi:hypothetical protein
MSKSCGRRATRGAQVLRRAARCSLRGASEVFFERIGVGRDEGARQKEVSFVGDCPFERLAFFDLESACESRRDGGVELLAAFAGDVLDFCLVTHDVVSAGGLVLRWSSAAGFDEKLSRKLET